jgi:hypothetical protein
MGKFLTFLLITAILACLSLTLWYFAIWFIFDQNDIFKWDWYVRAIYLFLGYRTTMGFLSNLINITIKQ